MDKTKTPKSTKRIGVFHIIKNSISRLPVLIDSLKNQLSSKPSPEAKTRVRDSSGNPFLG